MGIYCRLRAESGELDLDKNWDFLHFLLTGRTSEDEEGETSVVLGFLGDARTGVERGEDLGFGPARVFDEAAARAIAVAMDALADEAIAERMSSKAIVQCYPADGGIDRLDDSDRALLWKLVAEVRLFVRAARSGFSVELY